MNRKAQGMSVNMIILIVLGLVIVGVLIFMLGGKVKQFGTSTNDCTEKKGTCVEKATDCKGAIVGTLNCPKELKKDTGYCCVSYTEEEN
ncbi:hypothetical protein JW707_03665 [Candidatus Woesearchaeota archaeon]|nr:hypothetical protein [Candidatus Woesearchaeota archaeon]